MAIGTNSYGDPKEVAADVPRHTDNGIFTQSTKPSLSTVETWIDQVSGVLNIMLANIGFTDIPVTQTDVKAALDLFVNQEVAAMAEGVNGSGRFGPSTKQGGAKGRWAVIVGDAEEFLRSYPLGIERLGVTRSKDPVAGIAYRSTDEGGDDTFPIFQREAFGNTFTDWDE